MQKFKYEKVAQKVENLLEQKRKNGQGCKKAQILHKVHTCLQLLL